MRQQAATGLGSLNALLEASNLFQPLDDPAGAFTLFAPDDNAFTQTLANLYLTDLEYLLSNVQGVVPILEGHVVQGKLTSGDLSNGMLLTTANPERMLEVIVNDTGIFVKPSVGGEAAQLTSLDTVASTVGAEFVPAAEEAVGAPFVVSPAPEVMPIAPEMPLPAEGATATDTSAQGGGMASAGGATSASTTPMP